MRRATVVFVFALGTIGLTLMGVGCPGGSSGGSGALRLLITDKPFPFEFLAEATVTITRVEVRRSDAADEPNESLETSDDDAESNGSDTGGSDDADSADQPAEPTADNADADHGQEAEATDDADSGEGDVDDADEDDADSDDDDEGESTWLTIYEGQREFNLLDLQNGKTDLLADALVPANRYDQMRLIVSEGRVVLTDGREFPLSVSSGEQTGIKLHFDFEVGDQEQTVLLLDVDLSRCFRAIPPGHIDDVSTIREFTFHPSLAMRLINMLVAGSISGVVTDAAGNPIANAAVTTYRGDEEVSTTSSNPDGTYVLGGLPTGAYRVEASASGFEDAWQLDVGVQAGAATGGLNFALSATSTDDDPNAG